jgi:small subunit ribosomal protein S2
MQSIEKMLSDGTLESITKKERLTLTRDKEKMEKVLGGIAQLGRVPAALFLIDIGHEHIALAEAKRLGILTFGMVDTNCDPNKVDYAIPSNDDATKSIAIVVNYIAAAIAEGLSERQAAKDEEVEELTDDEKERKAARLQAEADAESGRGGRSRGGNTGGPGGAGGPGRRRVGGGGPGGGGGNRRPGGGR